MSKPIYKVIMDYQDHNGVWHWADIYGKTVGTSVVFDKTSTLFNPKLSIEVNEPGSFEFTMPPEHNGYSYPSLYKTSVEVFERVKEDNINARNAIRYATREGFPQTGDSSKLYIDMENSDVYRWDGSTFKTTNRYSEYYKSIFYGRVISISVDFYKQKTIRCEGCLAFLKDAVVHTLGNDSNNTWSPTGFFNAVLNEYRKWQRNGDRRAFEETINTIPESGGPVLTKSIYRYVELSKIWDTIEKDILNSEGGYLLINRPSLATFSSLPNDGSGVAIYHHSKIIWVCPDLEGNNPYPPVKYQIVSYDTEGVPSYVWITPTADVQYANNLMTLSIDQEVDDLCTAVAPVYKYETDTGKTKYTTIAGVTIDSSVGLNYSQEFTSSTILDILGNGSDCARMRRVCPAIVSIEIPSEDIVGSWTITFTARYTGGTSTYVYPDGYDTYWNLYNWRTDLLSATLTITHNEGDTTPNAKVKVKCSYSNIGSETAGSSPDTALLSIYNFDARNRYGFIPEILDVTSSGYEELSEQKTVAKRKQLLLKEAVDYLERKNYKFASYDVKAAELAYLKPSRTNFSLGTNACINSSEHAIVNVNLTVTKLEYSLDSALKTVTLGTPQMVTLTEYYKKKKKEYTKEYSIGGYTSS